jgi:hypothetical protein
VGNYAQSALQQVMIHLGKPLNSWVKKPVFLIRPPCRIFAHSRSNFLSLHMSLSDALRKAVLACKKTRYAIAVGSGVDHAVLRRFMLKERDIKLTTAEHLAEFLDLELSKRRKRKR